MKQLKKLRERKGYSQDQLAQMLGTTQQTIARWENGKSQPNLAALRDLAICLSTTVDFLVGRETALPHQTTDPLAWLSGDDSGFWGHAGIRVCETEKSLWYPITKETMSGIFRDLQVNNQWVMFQTLNNKFVIANVDKFKWVCLLDEADDSVCSEDWELTPDAFEGWPEDVYKCLDDINYEDAAKNDKFSRQLLELSKNLITDNDLSQDQIYEMCNATRIIFGDASNKTFYVSPDRLYDIFFSLEVGIESCDIRTLHLDDGFGERDVFVSLSNISVLELSRLRLIEGIESQTGTDDKP